MFNNRSMAWEEPSEVESTRPQAWKEEGGWWAGEGTTLMSFGKSDRDSFSLDFRWPLSPMQAFGLAVAALDTSI